MTQRERGPKEPIVLLEDRLAELDAGGTRGERWWGQQRFGHAVGALVTAVLLLAWALHSAAPGLAHQLAHALHVVH